MLWLIMKKQSYQIIGCNIHFNEKTNNYELWVIRPEHKSIKIMESEDEARIREYKEAIDHAVTVNDKSLVLDF